MVAVKMLEVNRGQVIKFRYRKPGCKVSAGQYKGKVFNLVRNPNTRDIDVMLETSNGLIRRFHAKNIGQCQRVGIVERVLDWFNGTQYNRPIV